MELNMALAGALKVVQSYLSDRRKIGTWDEDDTKNVKHGVPQDSVSSLLLFGTANNALYCIWKDNCR